MSSDVTQDGADTSGGDTEPSIADELRTLTNVVEMLEECGISVTRCKRQPMAAVDGAVAELKIEAPVGALDVVKATRPDEVGVPDLASTNPDPGGESKSEVEDSGEEEEENMTPDKYTPDNLGKVKAYANRRKRPIVGFTKAVIEYLGNPDKVAITAENDKWQLLRAGDAKDPIQVHECSYNLDNRYKAGNIGSEGCKAMGIGEDVEYIEYHEDGDAVRIEAAEGSLADPKSVTPGQDITEEKCRAWRRRVNLGEQKKDVAKSADVRRGLVQHHLDGNCKHGVFEPDDLDSGTPPEEIKDVDGETCAEWQERLDDGDEIGDIVFDEEVDARIVHHHANGYCDCEVSEDDDEGGNADSEVHENTPLEAIFAGREGLSKGTANHLRQVGIETVGDVRTATDHELEQARCVGPGRVQKIRDAIEDAEQSTDGGTPERYQAKNLGEIQVTSSGPGRAAQVQVPRGAMDYLNNPDHISLDTYEDEWVIIGGDGGASTHPASKPRPTIPQRPIRQLGVEQGDTLAFVEHGNSRVRIEGVDCDLDDPGEDPFDASDEGPTVTPEMCADWRARIEDKRRSDIADDEDISQAIIARHVDGRCHCDHSEEDDDGGQDTGSKNDKSLEAIVGRSSASNEEELADALAGTNDTKDVQEALGLDRSDAVQLAAKLDFISELAAGGKGIDLDAAEEAVSEVVL